MKKKLAQILAVLLAVSCLSGCEFLLEDESYSESGYLESVESGDGGNNGTSENTPTVDIQSEKVKDEAEWNAAFDPALWDNYVYTGRTVDDGEVDYALAQVDNIAKKAQFMNTGYFEDEEYRFLMEYEGKPYAYEARMGWYLVAGTGEMLSYETWVANILGLFSVWELVGYFTGEIDDGTIDAETPQEMMKQMYREYSKILSVPLSYKNFTYNTTDKVYEADLFPCVPEEQRAEYEELRGISAKVWIKAGKIHTISFNLENLYRYEDESGEERRVREYIKHSFTFGTANVQVPEFNLE